MKFISPTILVLFFSACLHFPPPGENEDSNSGQGLSPSKQTYPLTRFSDIPFPSRFKYDRSKSFIYESGSGTLKAGRLFFKGWEKIDNVISFFQT